jgi:hypothetical protein
MCATGEVLNGLHGYIVTRLNEERAVELAAPISNRDVFSQLWNAH